MDHGQAVDAALRPSRVDRALLRRLVVLLHSRMTHTDDILNLAVLTVNYVVADGKSNWLEGAILFMLYVICAVIFWFYPGKLSLPCLRVI
jgi:Ca2+/Na+ antiporter